MKPRLHLISGPGITDRAAAEMSAMEAAVIRDEAIAHVRRMRLVMQTRFWTDPEFAVLARPIRESVESLARKVEEPEGRAA